MRIAMTRGVSPALARCELAFLPRVALDAGRARDQHREYERALRDLGCTVVSVAADPALPDCVFIEDVALVLDEVAVLLRPGAPSRRPEAAAVAEALAVYRPLRWIAEPATIDGGDVLRIGRTLFVGRSGRTSDAGAAALAAAVAPFGYDVRGVTVTGCLHLKSAVTQVGPDTVLVNAAWMGTEPLAGMRRVEVDPAEPHAANALWLGGDVIYPASFPRTIERLQAAGVSVRAVDVSELQKAEGAVTCCSLVFEAAEG